MTDPFEDAVRQAAYRLGEAGPAPTYHHAWKRGRRRRTAKQAALAFAGAVLLVAAFNISLPSFGDRSSDDQVAVELQAGGPNAVRATPTAVAQTAPLVTGSPGDATPQPTNDPAAVVEIEASGGASLTAGPTTAPTPSSTAGAAPAPEAGPAAPTAVPAPAPTVAATVPAAEPTAAAPTSAPAAAIEAAAPTPTPRGPETLAVPSPGGPVGPTAVPTPNEITTLQTPKPAAATIVAPITGIAVGVRCDIDGDGTADATCTIQPPYACTTAAEATLGYLAVDLDADGTIDTCTAATAAFCDTTGDGVGDTACLVVPDTTPN